MARRGPFVLAGVLLSLSASFAQKEPAGTKAPAVSAINSDLLVAGSTKRSSTASTFAQKKQALASYSRLPLSFEPNQGQAPNEVRFLSRGAAYNLFLTNGGAVLSLEHRQGLRDIGTLGKKPAVEASVPPDFLGIRLEKPSASAISAGQPTNQGKEVTIFPI